MVISPSALMGIMNLQLIIACKRSCGKVIFSVTSVCLSSQGGGASQRTITNDALYITLQDFPRQGLAQAPAGDIRWPSLETCSLQDRSHQYWHWWLLKHVRSSHTTARNLVERFIVLPAIKAIVTIDTMAFGFFLQRHVSKLLWNLTDTLTLRVSCSIQVPVSLTSVQDERVGRHLAELGGDVVERLLGDAGRHLGHGVLLLEESGPRRIEPVAVPRHSLLLGGEVRVLQDLIILINLSLKQWGTVMRYRGRCPPGSYRTYQPQPETMRYINKVQRYVSSSIQSVWLHHVLTSYSCWLTVPPAISFSAYLTRHVFICFIFLYMSGCVNIGSSISLCPFFR